MSGKNRGVVFACSDLRWWPETLGSAASFREHMPELARELYVTPAVRDAAGAALAELFTTTVVVDAPEFAPRPRFEACRLTKLDQAVFIDGDTLLVAPAPELFDVLDSFDVAAAAPQFLSPKAVRLGVFDALPPVSAALPEWNTGVLVANVDARFRTFVGAWAALYSKSNVLGHDMDQAAFRSAVVHSDLRIATLPNNYNLRANVPQVITGDVKILHAHGELTDIARTINAGDPIRVYMPRREQLHGFRPKAFSR